MTGFLLYCHIVAGVLAVVTGGAALTFKKGGWRHRRAGDLFVVSMVVMAGLGGYLAVLKPEVISVLNGPLTGYLVVTGWLAGRGASQETRFSASAAALIAFAIGTAHITFGVAASNSVEGVKDGFPPLAFYIFGTIALLAAIGDVQTAVKSPLSRAPRIARHLWRMGLGLFIATISLFLGQQDVFPESIRNPLLLSIPVLAVVLVIAYWWIRMLLARRRLAQPRLA